MQLKQLQAAAQASPLTDKFSYSFKLARKKIKNKDYPGEGGKSSKIAHIQ